MARSPTLVEPGQIESIHVGNAFGQLYTGQGHLGAMPASVVPELWGVPAMRHEAACASASMATLAAMAEIESGRYDCVLVLGAEQERNMPGAQAASVQSAAAWVGHETEGVAFFWPFASDRVAQEYDTRYGLDDTHLRAIGELNLTNAKNNPNAQTRAWQLGPENFGTDDHVNPVVHGRLRRNDCTQITDGTAGIVPVLTDGSPRMRRRARPESPAGGARPSASGSKRRWPIRLAKNMSCPMSERPSRTPSPGRQSTA
ncbi:MAG: hypothetical protein R2706_20225 [Acidimicrobiales bacterium]